MSLDLYCGSLSKYYSRQFETPQARVAREKGLEYRLVYEGEPVDWPDSDDAGRRVDDFQSRIQEKNAAVTSWEDDNPNYFAEQLFDYSLNGLLLACAYHYRPELTRPASSLNGLSGDPAYDEAVDREYYFGPLAISEAHLYVPADVDALLMCKDPMGWDIVVTTTSNLRYALDWSRKNIWNGETDVDLWFKEGPHREPA